MEPPTAVTIKVRETGPYKVTGPVAIHDADGRITRSDETVVLCRCGRSGAAPRCDGSHRE